MENRSPIRLLAAGEVTDPESIKGAMSFTEIRRTLCRAFTEAYPETHGDIMDVYSDHVIVMDGTNKLFEVSYAIDDNGRVTMGAMAPVRKQVDYVRISAASLLQAAAVEPSSPDYGYKWRVQIVEAGVDKQKGANYPYEVLRAAKPLYEGARVFALQEAQHTMNPFGKSVRDLVGFLADVTENATGLEGTLTILKSAGWLKDMIVDSFARNKPDLVGLSHDVLGTVAVRGGVKEVEKIVKVDSVDVVYDPIAGGKFLRMAAAFQAGREEGTMNLEKLLAALKSARPDAYKGIEAKINDKSISVDEVVNLLAAGGTDQLKDLDTRITAAVNAAVSGIAGTSNEEARQILEQARIVACGTTLKEELRESQLPELSQARLQKQFEGKVFEVEALRAAVKDEKEYLDKLTGSGIITGAGDIRMGADEPEKLQAAFDKLMGVTVDDKFKDVAPLASLRAAYTRITGDSEVRGVPSREGLKTGEAMMQMLRLPAAYSSASFSFVLGNSMYRRLVQEYRAVDYNESALVSYRRNALDFKTMESIQVGYFNDLPDVDPESGDYQEISMASDEEITYALNQKGIILSVTRRVIINDDLKSVSTLISRMGRAARRTYARRGWAKINSNGTYKGDGKNLFHNDHANLGATALSVDAAGVAALTARLTAMFNQTEKDSGEALCLEAEKVWVPRALLETMKALNSPWPGAAVPNPHAGRFGSNHENIILNKLATDTTDWGLIANPGDVELLEVAHLNGRQEPELFVADNPLAGQMFVADKIQYKQRHEYEWEIADYRGFDKSVVAG